MPELIDVNSNNKYFLAALESFSAADKDKQDAIIASKKVTGGIEVTMLLNGQEVSFKAVIDKLLSGYGQAVHAEARKLIEERGAVLVDTLQKLDRWAQEIELHFKHEAMRIVPEALTEEDFR